LKEAFSKTISVFEMNISFQALGTFKGDHLVTVEPNSEILIIFSSFNLPLFNLPMQ
jgi:hypothetical protein